MGHRDKTKKLGMKRPHRISMFANMTMSLVEHRMIKTTDAKAKVLRPLVDRLITTAKKGTLASKRQVAETLHIPKIFKKFYEEVVPQFADRQSGFVKIMKLGVRRGDGALVSVVELMTAKPVAADKDTKDKKVAKEKKTAKEARADKKADKLKADAPSAG
jgi:large subunit ribosomal protein L17